MTLTILNRQQQLAFDIGKKNGTAGSLQQQRAAQASARITPHASVIQGPRNPFQPSLHTSFVRTPKLHKRSRLLNCPLEVRRLIYKYMEDHTKSMIEGDSDWSRSRKRNYAPLYATCQKIYKELHVVEFEALLVPENRIRDLTTSHLFSAGFDYDRATGAYSLKTRSVALKTFTRLIIEVPLTALRPDLIKIQLAISSLPLQHLSLQFTGPDDYGTSTVAAFSCGLRPEQSSRRLTAAGQLFRHRARFINSLSKLTKLETLVISNANLPVTYNQVANNKSKLKRLSIIADCRSSLTYDWHNAVQNCNSPAMQKLVQGSMIPLNIRVMSPLQELEISANAMVYSSNLVRHALPGLKKLTWFVPDPSHQAGDLPGENLNFIGQTSRLIQNAAIYGTELETLRICLEPSIFDTFAVMDRNDKAEVAALVNSLNTELKGIGSLKNFELHMNYIPQFEKDGFAFANNLGDSLERFFVSEKTFVTRNEEIPFASIPVSKADFAHDPRTSEDALTHFPATTSVSATHYLVRQLTHENFGVPSFSASSFSIKNIPLAAVESTPKYDQDSPFITPAKEERLSTRTDRISYTKHLAFLHYEFTDTRHNTLRVIESTETNPITPPSDLPEVDEDRFRLLRLNGRLLDRERNKHLFADGYRPRLVLDDGKDDVVARPESLPARRYPVVVRFGLGHGHGEGHWMCKT